MALNAKLNSEEKLTLSSKSDPETKQNLFWTVNDAIGRYVVSTIAELLKMWLMVYLSFRSAFYHQSQGLRTVFGVVSSQIYFTGWQAMPLITVLALATGGIVVLQSSMQLSLLGGSSMLGNLLIVIIVREIGPLLTALIVIARSGTAVASEIGNMRAGREIEALEAMGIDPYSFIVFPRVLGGVISVVCLAFFFDLVAISGGYLLTRVIHGVPLGFFADSLALALTAEDVGLFFMKNAFSGVIIFAVACHQGMQVQQSSHEVPMVTTRAVVNSIIYVTMFNLAVSSLYYFNQFMKFGLI